MDLDAALATAEAAAREAGAFVQAARARLAGLEVTHKAPGDLASDIDREAEALIGARLRAAFPGVALLGEESGGALGAGACWIVDPIDGSANYLRGYPQYAVSIALALDGEPVLGVVHDPCRGETFAARTGSGLRVDGARVPVAAAHDGTRGTLAATVFPKPASPRLDAYLGELGRVMRAYGGVRRSGAMTLELAYLAAGRVDAFWAQDMGAWDVAAGIVLLREAGRAIVSRDGLPLLASRSWAAAAPARLPALLALLDGA